MPRVTPGQWSDRGERAAVWPGRNLAPGVVVVGAEATNFAVHAPQATGVWVCLFDDDGTRDAGTS